MIRPTPNRRPLAWLLAAGIALALALGGLTVASRDSCAQGGGGCLGHICVNSGGCPRGCFCAKGHPSDPTGDCR